MISQGLDLHNKIYFTNWYEWNPITKTLLKVMLIQAQQPVYVKIGKVAPMTLETFKGIASTCYSYYTMLQRIRE